MRVTTDQRYRDIVPAPDAERAAREAFGEIARAEVKAARALATMERTRCYVRSGFASVQSWAAMIGYGPQQVHRLLALGRTLLHTPALEPKVRAGAVAAESAVSVGKVLLEPALELDATEKDAWVCKAETVAPRALRDEAESTVESARQGAPTLPLRLIVTKQARDGFRRVRLLMSKGESRWITEGDTLGRLVRDWLSRNDPRLLPLPERRAGPTRGRRSRYRPRRENAKVERRSGGMCEVCGVRRATQKIHFRVPHARGGGQEADNIADACGECHVLVDAGVFVFSCFDAAGGPRWRFRPGSLGESSPDERVRERAQRYAAVSPFG